MNRFFRVVVLLRLLRAVRINRDRDERNLFSRLVESEERDLLAKHVRDEQRIERLVSFFSRCQIAVRSSFFVVVAAV